MFGKMFSKLLSGLKKFFTMDKLMIVIVLVLIYAFMQYNNNKGTIVNNMDTGSEEAAPAEEEVVAAPSAASSSYTAHETADPASLLPSDSNSEWAALNPGAVNGNEVAMPDLLQAGHHIGLDTIGKSLRNANLQLRSDPAISKADVGPWHQSTIEADANRAPLEIGASSK